VVQELPVEPITGAAGAAVAVPPPAGTTDVASRAAMAAGAGSVRASRAAAAPGTGSAVAASTADMTTTRDGALAALLSVVRSVPWLDPAALDDYLIAERGPDVALTVTSSPTGAAVAIDGRVLGRTPISLSVDRGGYDFTLVLALAHHAERTITVSAALDRTEHVVLSPLVARTVISKPPGAELLSNGELLGTTPLAIELPRSDEAEPLTLRLAGYVEQTIDIVPDRPGTTSVVLEREPQLVTHELGCDPECDVVLGGDVVGKAAPGSPYRVEFLERKGQWRTYVLRPIGGQHRPTSFRAPADRSVTTTIRLPCAPRPRADALAGPHIYDPYDPCRER
jgi:hypothetical protein